jgi:hypothetical protein
MQKTTSKNIVGKEIHIPQEIHVNEEFKTALVEIFAIVTVYLI